MKKRILIGLVLLVIGIGAASALVYLENPIDFPVNI